jgi:GT2 family glycosyltransferase
VQTPELEPELSIIVVAYRNPQLTRACLRSVFEQTSGAFEVVVLDNASGDGTAEMIAAEFPAARLHALPDNIGFARGNNVAATHARGEWLLLLNPDTVRTVGAISGCLLLVRRALWDRLGGFDERFFMYGEDIDLSMRARALGFAPLVTPAATIVHVVGASAPGSGAKATQVLRARATLMRKHWPRWRAAAGLALLACGVALRATGATVLEATVGRRIGGQWQEAWQRRAEWRAGYPEGPDGGPNGAAGGREERPAFRNPG